jgi:hypothetical protein
VVAGRRSSLISALSGRRLFPADIEERRPPPEAAPIKIIGE